MAKTNTRTPIEMGTLENNPEVCVIRKRRHLVDSLREASPEKSLSLLKHEDVDDITAQREKDRRIRNEQLKNAWLNKCQKRKQREYSVAIDFHTSVLARKFDGFLVL